MGLSRRAIKGTVSWLKNGQNQISQHEAGGIGLRAVAMVVPSQIESKYEAAAHLPRAAASLEMRDGIIRPKVWF
jgi:hypothetical protein